MTDPLRILFAGTPEFAAHILDALLTSPHTIVGVYTQPDRPAGRGKKLTPSRVKQLALQHDLPIYQPLNFRAEPERQELASLRPDIMIVVAYGLILPQAILDIPRLGCLNVHASLLPRWRGAAPIQRAIEAGDTETGVTIMQMDAGLDTGAMLVKRATPISADDTSATLHDRLATLGADALLEALQQAVTGSLQPELQDETQANYARKLNKDEGRLDWQEAADTLARRVQAFNPWPIAFCQLDGTTVRIWNAQSSSGHSDLLPGTIVSADKTGIAVSCGQGTLRITRLQWPGGKPLAVNDMLNARRAAFAPGQRFD